MISGRSALPDANEVNLKIHLNITNIIVFYSTGKDTFQTGIVFGHPAGHSTLDEYHAKRLISNAFLLKK